MSVKINWIMVCLMAHLFLAHPIAAAECRCDILLIYAVPAREVEILFLQCSQVHIILYVLSSVSNCPFPDKRFWDPLQAYMRNKKAANKLQRSIST